MQPGAQNPPTRATTYTPRDASGLKHAKPSHQVQPGAQKPTPRPYQLHPRRLTKYQKTLAEKHAIDAQITAKNTKATALKTTYSQLTGKPIEHFQVKRPGFCSYFMPIAFLVIAIGLLYPTSPSKPRPGM